MPARNISEYPQLLNAIHSAEKIVYLCGAGASMSLGSHRLSWTNWIAEGRKYLTIPEQNELNLKIGSWTAEELIDAATFLLGKLKSSGAYQTFMNQTIGALHPVNTEFKEALCKVWRAGDLTATTNYDTQIEETLNAKGVSYECPAEILSIIRSTAENKVIHLHGMYDERDGIDNIIADYPCIFGRRLLLRVKPYIHRRRNISEFLIKLLIRQSNGLNSIQRKSNFRRHTLAYYFQD